MLNNQHDAGVIISFQRFCGNSYLTLNPTLMFMFYLGSLTYMGWAELLSYRAAHQVGSGFQLPRLEPLHAQYMQHTADSLLQAAGTLDHFSSLDSLGTSDMDLPGYSKAYCSGQFPTPRDYGTCTSNPWMDA